LVSWVKRHNRRFTQIFLSSFDMLHASALLTSEDPSNKPLMRFVISTR